jgi:glycosyltransferase involved in cell wall biosynthesis
MRVGFDMTSARVSQAGVGRYARELRRALDDVDAVTIEELGLDESHGIRFARRAIYGLRRELLYYPLLLRREAAKRRVDVIHCPGPFGPHVSQPLVLTVLDLLPWRYPELFTRTNVLHQRLVVRRAIRRATRIVVGSTHVLEEVVELTGMPRERLAVTPLGVSNAFRPTARDPAWLERRFGINGPFVLTVGTLEPRKNLSTLLGAFTQLARDFDYLTLVVAGAAGWKSAELEQRLASARGRIVATGHVSDDELIRLYGSAACFVFPSLYEGIGLPPLEAMACGTPVVAGNRTSMPEVVGDAGVLVDVTEEESLAQAIASVVTSPELAASLRERGLARARAFSWAACARATTEVYRDAAAD